MYTFYIDIGSWTSPVIGGGYILCHPRYEECTLTKGKESEKIFSRIKLNGDLIFTGAEYDALKLLSATENQVHLKVYYKIFGLRLTAYLQLQGHYDENSKHAVLNSQPDDRYAKLMADMGKDFNLALGVKHTVQVDASTYLDTFYEGYSPGGEQLGAENYAWCGGITATEWSATTNYHIATHLGLIWQGAMNCFCLYGGKTYASLMGGINHLPPNPFYWALLEGGLATFSQERSETYFENATYDTSLGLWVRANCVSNAFSYNLTQCMSLYDVLKSMLLQIDPTILITDNIITGGVNLYAPYLIADPELNHIFIADKSDIKYFTATNPASYEFIKLAQVLEIYKGMFNLDWKINNNGYFQFVHPTEYSKILPLETVKPLHFLTTVRSRNWTKDRKLYKLTEDANIHKEIWQFEKSNSWDFDGVPIVYYNSNTNDKTYPLDYVNCNLSEMMSGVNSMASDNGVAIIAGIWVSDHYETVDKLGHMGERLVNGKLATSRLITEHHITGGRPYSKGNVNEVENVALVTGNNKEVPDLIVPSQDIDSIDFDYLVETDLGNLEPVNFEVPLNGSFSKLKCTFK